MHNPTIIDYTEACDAIGAEMEALSGVGKYLDRRRYISSKTDFVNKFGFLIDGTKEIRFFEFDFLKFEDDADEGHDDCPVLNVTLGIHLFHEFRDLRSDGSFSLADFVSAILILRNFFLSRREFELDSGKTIVCDPIVQPEFAQFGADTFSDCKGHFTDLNLKVAFYDTAN